MTESRLSQVRAGSGQVHESSRTSAWTPWGAAGSFTWKPGAQEARRGREKGLQLPEGLMCQHSVLREEQDQGRASGNNWRWHAG